MKKYDYERIIEVVPTGHENAATRSELSLRTGYPDRVIRDAINKSEELIINLQDGKGYFKPLPEEENLVTAWIMQFDSRIKDEQRRLSLAINWMGKL